jgi:hypothetical protein
LPKSCRDGVGVVPAFDPQGGNVAVVACVVVDAGAVVPVVGRVAEVVDDVESATVVEVVSELDVVVDSVVVVAHGSVVVAVGSSGHGGSDDVVVDRSALSTVPGKLVTFENRPTSPPTIPTHSDMNLRQISAGNDPPVTDRPCTSLMNRGSLTPSPSVSTGS